jgi:DNA gyrase subunit A
MMRNSVLYILSKVKRVVRDPNSPQPARAKATPKMGKVSSINLVDETSVLMGISRFGTIIRIDTKSIRAAGRSTQGVKLLDLEPQDKVAAAVVIPPEEAKTQPEEGTLLQ